MRWTPNAITKVISLERECTAILKLYPKKKTPEDAFLGEILSPPFLCGIAGGYGLPW